MSPSRPIIAPNRMTVRFHMTFHMTFHMMFHGLVHTMVHSVDDQVPHVHDPPPTIPIPARPAGHAPVSAMP